MHVFHTTLYIDVGGRRKGIIDYLQKINEKVYTTDDPSALDHVLSLLMQAAASMDVVTSQSENMPPFEVRDKFAPTQKNETQLKLWRTGKRPGRKCAKAILRYTCTQVQ